MAKILAEIWSAKTFHGVGKANHAEAYGIVLVGGVVIGKKTSEMVRDPAGAGMGDLPASLFPLIGTSVFGSGGLQ